MRRITALPAPVTGAALMVLLIANTIAWSPLLLTAILARAILPKQRWRRRAGRVVEFVAANWMRVNLWFVDRFLEIDWQVNIEADVSLERSYIITANHQSWVDILALYKAVLGKVPFLRFFLKHQLIYIPILGLAWWGLDFPFMRRYTKEQIEKNPALKGKDLETTRRACDRFRDRPVSILNFLEGTRFREAAHAKKQSPYDHLLKPRAGGLAFAMSAMGDQLHSLLNITLAYPKGVGELWDFLCGRVPEIVVHVEERPIPRHFFTGDYQNDPEFRAEFQAWTAELWAEKDQRLQALLNPDRMR